MRPSSVCSCSETARFNRESDYDACAYSVLTPYPGTLTWYEMKKANRIVSNDWEKYDQSHVVYRPAQMSGDDLRVGQSQAYQAFYSLPSIASPASVELLILDDWGLAPLTSQCRSGHGVIAG